MSRARHRWPPPIVRQPVRCGCGKVHRVAAETVGKTLRCRCGRETIVPAAGRWIALGVLLLALLLTGMVTQLTDRWAPATIFAFGPRWVALIPVLLAVPVVLAWAPRHLVTLAGALALVLVPVMGWRLGTGRWSARPLVTMRILSWNIAGSDAPTDHLAELLERWHPDVLAFQECNEVAAAALVRVRGMVSRRDAGGICVLSRFPILRADSMDRLGLDAPRAAGFGGSAIVWRYRLALAEDTVSLVVLHLETPRKGFEGERGYDFGRLSGNTEIRAIESRRASRFVRDGPAPHLVAGDFNMPVESSLWHESWRRFHDAWDDAGLGFGWTRNNGKIRVRIDHVLSESPWRAIHATVGDEPWSDHWPLIVDLGR